MEMGRKTSKTAKIVFLFSMELSEEKVSDRRLTKKYKEA